MTLFCPIAGLHRPVLIFTLSDASVSSNGILPLYTTRSIGNACFSRNNGPFYSSLCLDIVRLLRTPLPYFHVGRGSARNRGRAFLS